MPRREWLGLIAAVLILMAVNFGSVHDRAERSFSAHMVQHMVLIFTVAPLFAVSWPFLEEILQTGLRSLRGDPERFPRLAVIRFWFHPAPALAISTVALWAWHLPSVYNAAVRNDFIHSIEHLVFVAAFIPFWRPLIRDRSNGPGLGSNGLRVLYLSLGMLAHGLLGAYLTLVDRPLYSVYAAFAPGGRSALADQRIGGAIMWIVGTLAMITVAIVTMQDEP